MRPRLILTQEHAIAARDAFAVLNRVDGNGYLRLGKSQIDPESGLPYKPFRVIWLSSGAVSVQRLGNPGDVVVTEEYASLDEFCEAYGLDKLALPLAPCYNGAPDNKESDVTRVTRFVLWYTRCVPDEYKKYAQDGMLLQYKAKGEFDNVLAQSAWEGWQGAFSQIPKPAGLTADGDFAEFRFANADRRKEFVNMLVVER